jgi:probable F420-dependent oxidoreductase
MNEAGRAMSGDRRLTFGLTVPSRGPLARPEVASRVVASAERLGYDLVAVTDHVVLPTSSSAPYPYSASGQPAWAAGDDYLEPFAFMGWLLGQTRRLEVVTSVLVVPYRNPVVVAKQLATLDALSGGRVVVGIGVGWWPEEFVALAAPPFAERGAVTDEYVRLWKELWTAEEPRFDGRYYRLADVRLNPKPARKPHPPIWVGGHTDAAIRRTARLGDVWHPIGLRGNVGLGPDELADKVAQLREETARAGRAPDAVRVAFRAPLDLWPSRGRPPADAVERPLAGPPSKVIEDLRAYQRAGVSTFIFDFAASDPRGILEAMRRFIAEVRPALMRRTRRSGGR